MTERDITWLYPKSTMVKDAWIITLCGFESAELPATASFIWPTDTPLTIPKEWVLISVDTFRELCRYAGHATGIVIGGDGECVPHGDK